MRVAITGSSGFLGSALVRRLRDEGHQVERIVRPATGGSGIDWNPKAGTIDAPSLEGIDAAVHLAGVGIGDRRWTRARKALLRESRITSGALLARAVAGLRKPPTVVVGGSAIGFYGDRGAQILDEGSGPGHGFLAELCRAWEDALQPAADAGIRVVSIRTGVVLGRGGALFRRLVPAFRVGLGARLGDGTQYMSWISLEDHIAAVSWLLQSEIAGPVNLTAPEPVTNAEFTRAMGAALHRPSSMVVPRAAIAAVLGRELAADLLASQRVLPAKLSGSSFRFQHPELAGALASIFA